MEVRPDTSSGRSHDGWSFLNHGTVATADTQARSLPPSSYVRSDRSTLSPLPNGYHTYNGSRSSFSRNLPSASTGARSTTTIPSQPVLLRINSATAYDHNHRAPRRNRRPVKLDSNNGLPAQEEFSIQAILSAIREDIEGDLNTISEVLGRSRFMLSDQYESQLPPQGEIILESPSRGIEEATTNHEHLATDDVMIVHEDASLVEGSHSGSAAYRLMERLQTVPAPARINSDAPALTRTAEHVILPPTRTRSSPAVVQPEPETHHTASNTRHEYPTASLRTARHGPSRPIVSETYLSAEADGVTPGMVPVISEAGRKFPLYTADTTDLFQPTYTGRTETGLPTRATGWFTPDILAFTSWFSRGHRNIEESAEASLRGLLNR